MSIVNYSAHSQTYKFQQFSREKNGLCHQFVNSISQDKHGFIWFATGLGLCRYDGFTFTSPDSDLPAGNVTTSFRDDKGDLWFGYNNGLTVKYNGFNFSIVDTSVNKSAVTDIIQAPGGEILVSTQSGGITRFFDKRTDRLSLSCGEGETVMINTMCFANNNKLLIGSFDGLFLYNYPSPTLPTGGEVGLLSGNSELFYLSVVAITPKVDGTGFWVATDEDGVYYVTLNGNNFTTIPLIIPELEHAQVQALYEDSNNHLWISTSGKGLLRVHYSPDLEILKTNIYNSANGLGSDFVKQAFFDNMFNLWVATSGQGVSCITNLAFSFFDDLNPIGNNATALFSENSSEYWIAGIGTIMIIKPHPQPLSKGEGGELNRMIIGRANGLPNDKITTLVMDDNDNLWIGTEKNGLYKLASASLINSDKSTQKVLPFYREENSLSNAIQKIIIDGDKIWMATRFGVIAVDIKTGKKTEHYTTFNGGLPHNWIRDIYKDSKNRIWIATNSNSLIDIKNNKRLFLQENFEVAEFSAIAEDNLGRIWAATNGKGVYVFEESGKNNDYIIYQFTTEDGLLSDFCYAINFDGNNQIWLGHRLGLSSINTERFTVNNFGEDNGIYGDVNPLAMILNKSGEMIIGMNDGVMLYDVKADKTHEQIPMLNLISVIINDRPFDIKLSNVLINDQFYNIYEPIELKYGRYKLQFDFVGLQYSNPKSVSYQYKLQSHSDPNSEWTPFTKSTTVLFPRIEDGTYSFWVKACNNTNCTEEMLLITIKVSKPFWKTWWFILSVIAGVILLIYITIFIRERNHRKLQEYLENELKERTKEVHQQKEEIEIKNNDITDSINYAQRIQSSVLPSISILHDHFSDAFIFYRPREIVSGDFYWFDYFPESRNVLLVCADSTGHGVPGAFMSLIGITLIKDITILPDVLSPANVLYLLDDKIHSMLNRSRELEHASDGMDITVCEINTETYNVRIASAMRPYIIYKDGIPTVYKGSLSSIGGQQSIDSKIFETNELQLSKGDSIYMFSDGYADQFGGPEGRRMKMIRLQNIINDINTKKMDEQYNIIKDNFYNWKGDNEQVDDVLIMGVKI